MPCTFDYNTNAGTARSYGSEAEIHFKPISSLTLALSGAYTNARLTSNVPALGIPSGQAAPGVPNISPDVSARYSAPVNASLTAFAMANWNYVGHSHGTVGVTDPDYVRPSYAVTGLNAGVNYGDWEFAVFAKNLLNTDVIIQRPNLQTVNRGYTVTPRIIGVSGLVSF